MPSISSHDQFAIVPQGSKLFLENGELRDTIHDRTRLFLEESDQVAGMHVFIDTQSGFGGLGLSYLEMLSEGVLSV